MQMKRKKQKKSKLKDVDSTEADFDAGNGLERHEKKASSVTLKCNFVPFPSAFHAQGLSVDGNGDLDSDYSASRSVSDTDHYHRSARLKENTLRSTEGHSSNTFGSSPSSLSPSCKELPVSTPSKKNSAVVEKSKANVLSNKSEVETIQNENNYNNNISARLVSPDINRVQLEDDKNWSDEKSSIASDGNSSDCSVETSDMESSKKEIVIKRSRDQLSSEIATKLMGEVSLDPRTNSDRLLVGSPRTKDESKATDNPHKQKHSNEKRLDALKDKKMTVLAQRNLIKDALKDLDSGTQSHDRKKHIVFSDNDDDDDDDVSYGDVKEKAAFSIGDKVRVFDYCVLQIISRDRFSGYSVWL